MILIQLNGQPHEVPLDESVKLGKVMEFVRTQFASESHVVERVRINGLELNETEESALSAVPARDVHSIEVFTAHPRQIAEETLEMLLAFSGHLERQCLAVSQMTAPEKELEFEAHLHKLLDGVQTFSEGYYSVKQVLRIEGFPQTDLLEMDLLSILSDLKEYREAGRDDYVRALLSDALPKNFADWKSQGLPELIRARSS